MARLPRIAIAGQPHLVLLLGHARPVFRDDGDRESLLAIVSDAVASERLALHGYRLLDNEIRLLATPRSAESLSRAVQAIARRHSARYNRRHGSGGPMWSGRFRAGVIEASGWMLRCLQYVEAADPSAPADDRWSSAPHHLGRQRNPIISEHQGYWGLGNTPFERELAWLRVLERALTELETSKIRSSVLRGLPLGDADFTAATGAHFGMTLARRPAGKSGT